MKTRLLLLLLFNVLYSLSLFAQDDLEYTTVVDGHLYAVKDKVGKCGLLKGYITEFDSEDDVRAMVIIPVKYDDITFVAIVETDGNVSSDRAFCAVESGKYTLYDNEGYSMNLTEPMSTKFGWMSRALGTAFRFAGVYRPDGNGCDIQIIYDWPKLATTIKGPFDISFYQRVVIGDDVYYYINARKYGNNNETVKYDVFGNPLSDSDLSHLDVYYKNLREKLVREYKNASKSQQETAEYERKLYQAASIGDAKAVEGITKGYYAQKVYDRVMLWGSGPAIDAKTGDAVFYVAQCYRLGLGTPVMINNAKYYYQRAQELGCASAAAGLLAIQKIEEPITLKTDKEPVIDDLDAEGLEKAAKEGYVGAIETYCHRVTFHTFGCAWYDEQTSDMYTDKMVVEVLPLLLAAAPKNANCQLMLACVYAGPEAVGLERNYGYSFRNVEKAKYWIEKFCSNPGKGDAQGWGYKNDVVDAFISNIRNMKD